MASLPPSTLNGAHCPAVPIPWLLKYRQPTQPSLPLASLVRGNEDEVPPPSKRSGRALLLIHHYPPAPGLGNNDRAFHLGTGTRAVEMSEALPRTPHHPSPVRCLSTALALAEAQTIPKHIPSHM